MSVAGKIQEFKPEGEERFSTYVDRLQLYFHANSVAEGKKVAVFLTVIGARNSALLSDHFALVKPADQTLEDLIAILRSHFEPEPIIIAERFHFYKREQKSGESTQNFVADLRRLATNCQFGAHLDQALRDRFVCGLAVESIQKKLLVEKDLDLAKAVKMALSLLSADKTTRAIHGATSVQVQRCVHVLHKSNGPVQNSCYRCGRSGHSSDRCRFKEMTSHSCREVGHIAPACKSKPIRKERGNRPGHDKDRRKPGDARWISTDHVPDSDAEFEFSFLSLGNHRSQPPISVKLQLNGKYLQMELDTGAAMSLIRGYQGRIVSRHITMYI